MISPIINLIYKQILEAINENKRLDNRAFNEYRELKIEQGIFESAEGSARVVLGKTEVVVGIKVEIGKPFPDTPNSGVMTVNAELTPLASPEFEPGPPGEKAIELARIVDRGIRESKTIDVAKLCIEPGKKVFVVFVDIYVLNHDGNLIDASALAAISALNNTKIRKYEIVDGEIQIKSGYTSLPLSRTPITVTFAKINEKIIIDPCLTEEKVMDTRISIAIDANGDICAIQKGKSGYFTTKQILEIMQIAKDTVKEMRKKLGL